MSSSLPTLPEHRQARPEPRCRFAQLRLLSCPKSPSFFALSPHCRRSPNEQVCCRSRQIDAEHATLHAAIEAVLARSTNLAASWRVRGRASARRKFRAVRGTRRRRRDGRNLDDRSEPRNPQQAGRIDCRAAVLYRRASSRRQSSRQSNSRSASNLSSIKGPRLLGAAWRRFAGSFDRGGEVPQPIVANQAYP